VIRVGGADLISSVARGMGRPARPRASWYRPGSTASGWRRRRTRC